MCARAALASTTRAQLISRPQSSAASELRGAVRCGAVQVQVQVAVAVAVAVAGDQDATLSVLPVRQRSQSQCLAGPMATAFFYSTCTLPIPSSFRKFSSRLWPVRASNARAPAALTPFFQLPHP